MSSGAAGGFAHLGVLQVLEEAGVPVDYLCGTSMGGAVALLCAKTGSATRSIEISRDLVSRSNKIVDVALLPRSALLAGKKMERIADSLWGRCDVCRARQADRCGGLRSSKRGAFRLRTGTACLCCSCYHSHTGHLSARLLRRKNAG